MDYSRLSMPLGEAIFTQRSIRRFKPDPIPLADIQLILEAAVKAPNGGNQQVARFLVVSDRESIREFGALYREAWWAKRRDEGLRQPEDLPRRFLPAARLADAMSDVPCIVFALAMHNGPADSVIPAVQNLMLAARAIGIGSVPTTLHPSVMDRFRIAVTDRSPMAATMGAASWAASTTRASWSSPMSQMLFSTSKSCPSSENTPAVLTCSIISAPL
jgi:nitroreductase